MNQEEKLILEYITAIGAIITPILVALFSYFFWKWQKKIERQVDLENKLREDRVIIYNEIIDPYVILLMTQTAWDMTRKNLKEDKNDIAVKKLLSLEYRQTLFKMYLIGSDGVIKSHNELYQFFYQRDETKVATPVEGKNMVVLFGNFLLEIRKSMGNEQTKLENWDMIEGWMKDLNELKN